MNDFTLVAPFEQSLLERLESKRVIFISDDSVPPALVNRAAQDWRIDFQCMRISSPKQLFELDFDSMDWGDQPVAVEVAGVGRMRDLRRAHEWMSRTNVRVYAPAVTGADCSAIRMLSSLGINCCAVIPRQGSDTEIDWDALKELVTYSIYNAAPHADIDPFSYIARNCDGRGLTDFRAVYFDDPTRFLHVDAQGRLSLTRADQQNGVFLDIPIEDHCSVRESEVFGSLIDSWKAYFVERTPCSSCDGWRVCMGAFSVHGGKCSGVFTEVLEGVEQMRKVRGNGKAVWQP